MFRSHSLRVRVLSCVQSLDFFGAVRAATYDGQISEWITGLCGDYLSDDPDVDVQKLHRALLQSEAKPEIAPPTLTMDQLLAIGRRLADEQQAINDHKLSQEYFRQRTISDEEIRVAEEAKREAELRRAEEQVHRPLPSAIIRYHSVTIPLPPVAFGSHFLPTRYHP